MRSVNDSMVMLQWTTCSLSPRWFPVRQIHLFICLWKERRRILSLLPPSLSETCSAEVPLCSLSPSASPSAAPPLAAAPAGRSPASCPPETAEINNSHPCRLETGPWTFLALLTCQASSSWESATLCLMVLRSCWVSSSFSWRTVASSLSKELKFTGGNIGCSWVVEASSSKMIKEMNEKC